MNNKLIKIALIGKTNAGKSTLINTLVGEKISIINKKINTTQDSILGIKNIKDTQIIFFDTPGSNFLKTSNIQQKKMKTHIWQAIDNVDLLGYLIDVCKYNYDEILIDLKKISETNKSIIIIFNKIDLVENKKILPHIKELKNIPLVKDFFLVSAKYDNGIDDFLKYLISQSTQSKWLYNENEISDKDDIYIINKCTRNSILEYLHKEIPYNITVKNNIFKFLKNGDLKIKQLIEVNNIRYKPIIIGKKGASIKRIREKSQLEIQKIFNCKVHLYLQTVLNNEK